MKQGTLLINLGTPDAPETKAVRRYLKEFLSDPRVIDINPIVRWMLLNFFILPFRSPKSAEAYRAIWTEQGSPLLVHSQALVESLRKSNDSSEPIALGMRYGSPSISSAVEDLLAQGCQSLTILPLFPQYASSSSGSALEKALALLQEKWNIPQIKVISDFYSHSGYIDAYGMIIREAIQNQSIDHYIFSYHGLPVRHIKKSGCAKECSEPCPAVQDKNRFCYRAQCYETSRLLAKNLRLTSDNYTVAFQSRLGKTPWIRPYLDDILPSLAEAGHQNIAVACPAFVADCLETLEEIGIRAREDWKELTKGKGRLVLAPCLNSHPKWVATVKELQKSAFK